MVYVDFSYIFWYIVDVRISADFQARSIYNSKNIPFEDLLNRVSEIDETKKVVLICTIGLKSKEAISKLKKLVIKENFIV